MLSVVLARRQQSSAQTTWCALNDCPGPAQRFSYGLRFCWPFTAQLQITTRVFRHCECALCMSVSSPGRLSLTVTLALHTGTRQTQLFKPGYVCRSRSRATEFGAAGLPLGLTAPWTHLPVQARGYSAGQINIQIGGNLTRPTATRAQFGSRPAQQAGHFTNQVSVCLSTAPGNFQRLRSARCLGSAQSAVNIRPVTHTGPGY